MANNNIRIEQKECTGASGNKSFDDKIYSEFITDEEMKNLSIEECKRISQERKRKAGFKKISNSIRRKALANKIITLRTKARLKKFIAKEFPYVEIKNISIDICHLTDEVSKEYDEELNRLKEEVTK